MEQKRKYLSILLAIFLVGLLVSVVVFSLMNKKPISNDGTPLRVKVGMTTFSDKDVANMIAIEKLYGNTSINEDTAYKMLIRDAKMQEVATRHGVFPTQIDIDTFNAHVEKNSKAKDTLQAIKDIFGSDTASYNRLYLLPRVVNPKLHSYFASTTSLHKGEGEKIALAYKEVSEGGSFKSVGEKYGLQYQKITFPDQAMISSYGPLGADKKKIAEEMLPSFIRALSVGGVSKVEEGNSGFVITKLLSKKDDIYEIESLEEKKKSFDEWYQEEVKKLPITIYEKK